MRGPWTTPGGADRSPRVSGEDHGGFDERTVLSETMDVVGHPSPHLVVLNGERAGRHIPLTDRILVGRGVDCDLHLDVDDVSRKHAEVRVTEEGTYVVQDLGSQNGTWLNGVPVELQPLRPGDRLRIGGHTVVMLSLFGDVEGELLHQQRLESLGVVAGGIAHDFSNLMAVVLGNAEFLDVLPPDRDLGDEAVRSTVEDLRSAARHAAELSRQLLGLARRAPVDEQLIDVEQLAQDVVRIVRRRLGPDVQVEVSVRGPLVLVGDPAQLRQVLMNLCVNADDAMPEGGRLVLRAWSKKTAEGEFAHIEVEDTGEGMDEDDAARIFEPFFSGKALGRGTGLGLAIAKRIVLNHDGEIGVRSTKGEGTVFSLRLPVRTRADQATPPTRPAVGVPVTGDGAQVILVVEDDHLHARTLRRNLEHLGHLSEVAERAEEGLQTLQARAPEIGAVIVDADLGGLGAVEVCRTVRALHPEVKLIVSCGAIDDQLAALEGGAHPDAVLLKPYDRGSLQSELQRVLGC